MISADSLAELLTEQIRNVDTQWSIGTFGGIAEFARDADEPVEVVTSSETLSAITDRGGIAVTLRDDVIPFASESITKQSWARRVALCLPSEASEMNRHKILTELPRDANALRPQHREDFLFDLGLDALQVNLCIRVADEKNAIRLREYCGRSIFAPGNPAMSTILEINPHRVFASRLGRLEVYQPIPPATGKSPDGPHTHVLPKLLKTRRTHPATEPIPDRLVPCAHFYPAHPSKSPFGRDMPFVEARHLQFQHLLDRYGSSSATAMKRQVIEAIERGIAPSALQLNHRSTRTAVRVALRQLKSAGLTSDTLNTWQNEFDVIDWGEDDDDAERMHQH